MKTKVFAIVIAYNPIIEELTKNILSLKEQVEQVILVDNSSRPITDNDLLNLVDYMPNGCNLGIAEAQNIGILRAIKFGADYVILFDQDTSIPSNTVTLLVSGFEVASKEGLKLACIGPRVVDHFTGEKFAPSFQKDKKISEIITISKQIIASGKLIPVSLFDVVGLMESDLFIDGVDHEWCWRAKSYGYSVAICENAIVDHQLGDGRRKFLIFRYKYGSPIRLYYQYRNTLLLLKRSYVPLYWKLRQIFLFFPKLVIRGVIDKDRSFAIKFIKSGIKDGIKGKVGSYE